MSKLSTITLARDEEQMIEGCLKQLGFADECVVVIDDRSADATEDIARKAGAKVYRHTFTTFADAKNFALSKASHDWILEIDADERLTTGLQDEIAEQITQNTNAGYEIPFDNYLFAHNMQWGGWKEKHLRLYRKDAAKYKGDIHETLEFIDQDAPIGQLKHHIAHFSHRSIINNLHKTANYADVQAKELLAANHPSVSWKTFIKVILKEFWRRTINERGYRDGVAGWIECLYQPFSLFCVYVRLWELQQHPTLEEQYRKLEDTIGA